MDPFLYCKSHGIGVAWDAEAYEEELKCKFMVRVVGVCMREGE